MPVASKYDGLVDPWDRGPLAWRPRSSDQGALVRGDGTAYAVTNGIARFVGSNADAAWVLEALGLRTAAGGRSQDPASVESFGFQWSWDSTPRTAEDLEWRIASRFGCTRADFVGRRVLDAGCGAGAQAAALTEWGARVTAIDLSAAVDVAARLPALRAATVAQADLAHLPFPDGAFDVVYCEGVLQHTEDSAPILAEFRRVLALGGLLLATHYGEPKGVLRKARLRTRQAVRALAQKAPREWVFLASGVAAAMTMVPGLGFVLRNTVVAWNPRMPTFKATWSATYDSYGQHYYQRHLPGAIFVALVRAAGFEVADVGEQGGAVRAVAASSGS
jgi:SAM-dependent methyltransferase